MAQAAAMKKPAPAPAAAAASAPGADDARPASKKKGNLLIIIIAAIVVLAGAGGAAWYFMRGDAAADDAHSASAPPVFVALDQFTVNLQQDDNQQVQYLQVAITLKVSAASVGEAVNLRTPEIRNRILLLLSSKKPSEISSLDGKQKLADEIVQQVTAIVQPKPAAPEKKAGAGAKADAKAQAKGAKSAKGANHEAESGVEAVLFTHFIVQ